MSVLSGRFRGSLRAIVPALLLIAGSGCERGQPQTLDPPRRVIWITIDSLRADHLGTHGYERDTSPWIDAFADESVNFEWALTPSNETLVSVAAYFGGAPVSTLLDEGELVHLPERVDTLAERLQQAGVRTRAFTANPKITPAQGYAQGFDEYRMLASRATVRASLDEMIHELRTTYRPSGEREFIYLHTMDVHHPYRPAEPYASMFTQPYAGRHVREGTLVESDRVTLARGIQPYWSEHHNIQPADVEFLTGLYDGAIRETDEKLKDLLEALAWNPDRDVVIITADHGEHLLEMGWWTHFATLTPMEIRVPLIINYGGFAPRRVEEPVGLIDLNPTILELFGVEGASPHAESLAPVLQGTAAPANPVYAETQPRHGLSAALVDERLWYWMSGNRATIAPWHAWPYEEYLFDYHGDPRVETDLAAEQPDVAAVMNARLRELYPRWAAFESGRIAGDDSSVEFGPNLFAGAAAEVEDESIAASSDGSWRADTAPAAIQYHVAGLTPYEPLYLRVPYALDSGAIRFSFGPAEYLLPSRSNVREAWQFDAVKPTGGTRTLEATVVPTAETGTLEIAFIPGTRATVDAPSLHRMLFDWIEPWPRILGTGQSGPSMTPAEEERLKTLGYIGD